MSYSKNSILRYINNSPKVLFWDIGEALTFLLPFTVFALLRKTLAGFIIGVMFYQIYKFIRLQVSSPIAHAIYWYLPTPKGKYRIYIPSFIREFIG